MRKVGKGLLVSQNIKDYENTDDLNIVSRNGELFVLRSNHESEQGYDIIPANRR